MHYIIILLLIFLPACTSDIFHGSSPVDTPAIAPGTPTPPATPTPQGSISPSESGVTTHTTPLNNSDSGHSTQMNTEEETDIHIQTGSSATDNALDTSLREIDAIIGR